MSNRKTDIETISDLSAQQLSALPLLAVGISQKDVAAAIGVHANTIRRWTRDDESFRSELLAQKQELYEAGIARAHSVLDEHMDKGTRLEQWRAANTKLAHHSAMVRARSDFTTRHEGLERLRSALREITATDDGQEEAEFSVEDVADATEE